MQENRIFPLPLEFKQGELAFLINPTVLQDETGVTLIDCGYPRFLPVIETALEKHGISLPEVKRILLTHHDHDHMGAVHEWIARFSSVRVFCSQEQEPYVTGKRKSLRLEQAEQIHSSASPEERAGAAGFLEMLRSVEYPSKAEILKDGEWLPFGGGLRVLDTSGHMPGHLSFYHEKGKTLVSGDALIVEDGKLCIASPEFVLDKTGELRSLKKLLNWDIQKVICYHGGEYTSPDIRADLQRLLETGYRNMD